MQRYRLPSDYRKNHRITIKSLISKRSYYPRVQFIPKKKKNGIYVLLNGTASIDYYTSGISR